jgi:23S rRNA (cytosine1962-C5)-methyltransferase
MQNAMQHYALIDFGDGKRLEQWGAYRLVRPDPTASQMSEQPQEWQSADAVYTGEKGKGSWEGASALPDHWTVQFDDVQMVVRLAPYKHTGVFPEQHENWQWCRVQGVSRKLTVLNLFAYTGGATMALALDGHFVTHVDASKPAITWAKENAQLNALPGDRIRWILDDAASFVQKEKKRGKRYDAIILDPPAYGHSPSGKTWRMERDLAPLLEDCAALLSDDPSFLLLNGYAQHDTPESFHRLLSGIFHKRIPNHFPVIRTAELLLHCNDGRTLSTGVTARCTFA